MQCLRMLSFVETMGEMSQVRHLTMRRFTPRFYFMIDATLYSIASATFYPTTFYIFILQCSLSGDHEEHHDHYSPEKLNFRPNADAFLRRIAFKYMESML